ncbi:restriction endonuclease [Aeromonas dhakensis]|uniref:restriction endonuclease n=1 Tax=Aeromonas dhakensis TaxID=196024 RepID=UPI00370D38DF
MGSISFSKGDFADHLHELLGYKSGVAASIEYMCDFLTGTPYADDIINSEKYGIRIRSEDYESLYYELLHKVGATPRKLSGQFDVFNVIREIERSDGVKFAQMLMRIYHKHVQLEIEKSINENQKSLDPTSMLQEAFSLFGKKGLDGLIKIIEAMDEMQRYSPLSALRFGMWEDVINLDDLFKSHVPVVSDGTFLDQRFIDYLSVNSEKLNEIHWRKFEELTAECFTRFGYNVELGPGSNDDGVDVRVWHPECKGAPKYIIQCKRYKQKIEKLTIKGLYADVLHEGAEMGLLVTTSELSVGSKKTVSARGYPIEEINGEKIIEWLNKLRTPGTGIVRV